MPSFLSTLKNMLTFQEPARSEGFILTEDPAESITPPGGPVEEAPPQADGGKAFKQPRPLGVRRTGPEPGPAATDTQKPAGNLAGVRKQLETIYGSPADAGLILRDFFLGSQPPQAMLAVYRQGMAGKDKVAFVLRELMYCEGTKVDPAAGPTPDYVAAHLLPGAKLETQADWSKLTQHLNAGDTVLFGEGWTRALVVNTAQVTHRSLADPKREQVIRGAYEAFGEDLDTNLALVRNLLRTEKLAAKKVVIGSLSATPVVMVYLAGLASPKLVAEVWRRLNGIEIDYLNDSGLLEQLIEDNPYSPHPQMTATERPDRVAALLAEGRVAILSGGNPHVLVAPATLYELLHTSEDMYLRWPYGNWVRLIRNLAFYTSFLLPGIYLAVVLFHQEMVPMDLLLSLAGAREKVPFPSLMEVIIMEISFELIREAGERAPGLLGNTIGIVGALILGQAAVQAAIVSPILIIIVAITGLANFAIPDYSMAFSVRILRFFYILLGASLGFLGIALGLCLHMTAVANLKSFGVPYLAPVSPQTVTGRDVFWRGPVWRMERRPDYLGVQRGRRQPPVARQWDPPREKPGR
ncbi:MAG TPA: spore germination protein [Spirochaetia bacterium]|nr:spore germination protein [Spirochaetia bacterium]